MRVYWTPQALKDATAVFEHIAADDPLAAQQLQKRLFEMVETTLVVQPKIGRPGRVANTRELVVHHHYILAYRVHSERIELLTFRHTGRLWPNNF